MALKIGIIALSTYLLGLSIVYAVWSELWSVLLAVPLGLMALVLRPFPQHDSLVSGRSSKALCHERYSADKVSEMGDLDYIVVGSGMGGLSCATVLARMGHRVLVLEQHETDAGGGTHMFPTENGYTFDSGLHYTVQWSAPLFELTTGGATVRLAPLGVGDGTFDRVVLEGREPFGMRHREAHLPRLFEMFPEEHEGLERYLRDSEKMLGGTKWMLLARLLPPSWQRWVWRGPLRRFQALASRTTAEAIADYVQSPHLRSLLTSLWIDTGAVPSECSFYLGAAVQRGFPMEGGVYPEGGAEEFARCLVRVLEAHGGRVLVRAEVEEVLLDGAGAGSVGRAVGVRLTREKGGGVEIRCRRGIVSAAGFRNTFGPGGMVPEGARRAAGVPEELPGTPDSPSFVMANIGLRGGAAELGLDNCNWWFYPATPDGDALAELEKYLHAPLEQRRLPAFVTFPSIKNPQWAQKYPQKTTCQVLVMARYDWFAEFATVPDRERHEPYQRVKRLWREKCVDTLCEMLPQLREHIESVDISTPLTIADWLAEPRGGAVGLAPSPQRFSDFDGVNRHLDCVTAIPGLFLTGHDTLLPGVTLAQMMGIITAFRIAGFTTSMKYFLRSLFL